jgi:hypothetical protein
MRPWPACAALLIAVTLQAAAAADEPGNIGRMVDNARQALAERCVEASARAASTTDRNAVQEPLDRDLSCTCAPKALDIAFPADMRAGTTTSAAFTARMSGAMQACVARSMRRLVEEPCAHGTDPFVDEKDGASPSAKAHCQCARSELDKAAAGNPRKDADAAAARYAASPAAVDRRPASMQLLLDIVKTCAPETAK